MKLYAIGKPNKQVRMYIETADVSHAQLQLAIGEVYVEVTSRIDGKISSNGKSVIPAGINMFDELWKIRELRTSLLARCDYTIFPDSPFSAVERAAWMAYRTTLRDITEDQPNTMFDDIIWPEPPSPN